MKSSILEEAAGRPRLLVLGASGFLGAQVARRAPVWGDRDVEVFAASRKRPPDAVLEAGATHHVWDGEDLDATQALIESLEPHSVVLTAALSRVAECDRSPELAKTLNVELPGRVARACRALGARFVHVSTDLVFGQRAPTGRGFREEAGTAPTQLYGRTKAQGEQRVMAVDDSAIVVRLPLLFGDSLGRGLGASDALLAALDRGQTPTLFSDEFRTPIDVESAADALLECAWGARAGILHVAGPHRVSRWDLARQVLEQRGDKRTSRLRRVARPANSLAGERPADVSLDASRARACLATPLLGPPR